MNQRQKESVAKYLYDMSKAIHIGWLLGIATDKMSSTTAFLLAILAMELFFTAYRKEVSNG